MEADAGGGTREFATDDREATERLNTAEQQILEVASVVGVEFLRL